MNSIAKIRKSRIKYSRRVRIYAGRNKKHRETDKARHKQDGYLNSETMKGIITHNGLKIAEMIIDSAMVAKMMEKGDLPDGEDFKNLLKKLFVEGIKLNAENDDKIAVDIMNTSFYEMNEEEIIRGLEIQIVI